MDIKRILDKQKKYKDNLNKISKELLNKIDMAFNIEFTHNSTAIEGNTLTLIETKVLLEDQITIGGKSLRELHEVVNNHKANLYVNKCVNEKKQLSEEVIKDIHAIINENILIGGVYRNEPVIITGASHKPPMGQNMFNQIKDFYYDLDNTSMNPIEYAAWTHTEFVRIHPFIDGNGRTSRLIMNYQLMLHGFPPISISVKDRLDYYEALDEYASKNDITKFYNMILSLVEKRLDEYIEIINNIK